MAAAMIGKPPIERVLELLTAHPGQSLRSIANHTGLRQKDVERALAELEAEGSVRRTPARGRTPVMFDPVPGGRRQLSLFGVKP